MSHQTVSIDGKSYPNVKGVAPGGRLECCADLPGLWYASAYHDGYKASVGAVHHRQIIVLKEGPILIVDRMEDGEGHTAQWNFHTPLETTVEPDRSVTLRGKESYRLVPAHPNELTDVKTHRHWAAVLPRDCQPDDCGAEVTGLAFEKPIEADGARFAMALFGGEGSIREESNGVFRLCGPDDQYLVLSGSQEAVHDEHGIQAEGRLTVLRFAERRPTRAWIVEGTELVIDRQTLFTGDQPATKEIAIDF
jgi:hypothetical protein